MGNEVVMVLLVERTVVQGLSVRRMLGRIPLLEREDLTVMLLGVLPDQKGFLLLPLVLRKIVQ